ncbi:MAG: hypothetical protein BWY57_01303 [Betaproteobacteria bacterium ADurb.Bin341]|nr:MAG: hypothetical protein BWY57_01303 [Betaproteobacteria bacterium ADurb.Bin341]
MKKLKPLLVAGLVILLSACASGPKMAEVQSSIPTLKTNEGRIYFYRAGSMVGAAIQPNISLNSKVVGESIPGGFFFIDQPPGPMEVVVATEVEKKLTFMLEAGQIRYVRTTIGFGLLAGRVYPELVDNATAEKEIADTAYTGTPLKR